MSASVVVLLTGLAIGLALGFFIASLKNKADQAQGDSASAAIAAELAGAKALVENLTAQIYKKYHNYLWWKFKQSNYYKRRSMEDPISQCTF